MNKFRKLPPDSGNWHYVKKNSKFFTFKKTWLESLDDPMLFEESFQVRKDGLYNITSDGFPRQGNRYLRNKILFSFPSSAMPYPLIHKQVIMEKAIQEKHFVFSTFRDPLDSISSYVSEFSKHQKDKNFVLGMVNNTLYTENDYVFLEKCFQFYARMTDFIYNNIDNLYVVLFSSIENDLNNSISYKIANIINDSNFVNSPQAIPHSSKDNQLKTYLSSKKFKDLNILVYDSYNNVLSLQKTYPQRFI